MEFMPRLDLVKSRIDSPSPLSQKQSPPTQSSILKKIESVGKALRELPTGADSTGFVDGFKGYISTINQAPDRDHSSGLFGTETTNREENLYLLMTAVDSANVTEKTKKDLLQLLNDELAKSKGANSYFNKIDEIEKGLKSPVVAGKPSLLFPSQRKLALEPRTLNIEGQQFNIENTSGLKNDCLAYALRSDNHPLISGYRSRIFTVANIQDQLNRIVGQHARNEQSNSEDDLTTDLNFAINQVKEGYNVAIPDNVNSMDELSRVLAKHIQHNDCFLDSFIAGGIFAKEYKQPIVIVSKNTVGASVFYVLNANGELVHEGKDLSKFNNELDNAKYIFNETGVHFERMVPVASAR